MFVKFVKPDNSILSVGDNLDWRLQKKGLDGFSSFEAKMSVVDDYARDGGKLEGLRLEEKKRTIKICNVNWRNADVDRDKIRRFFTYGTTYKIYITQGNNTRWAEGTLYRMAVTEPTNEDYLLKATLSFEFDLPYLLSVDNYGKDIASLTPHFGFPWISKVGSGTYVAVYNFERTVTIRNDGDNIAYPRIKISFRNRVVNPVVSINEGFIRFIGEYDRQDNLTIDYTVNPPRIENNGENILGACDRDSDFDSMYIMLGENTVSFDAENGSEEMSVSVFYNQMFTMV